MSLKKTDIEARIELTKPTPFDFFVIVLIVLLSIGIIARASLGSNPLATKGGSAVVYCDGLEIQRIDLNKHMETTLYGGKMVVVVSDGKISIKESDCPKNTCVHAGWIHLSGETLVCVPNKTVIEIIAGAGHGVDVVAF